jgi:hypothetical protein
MNQKHSKIIDLILITTKKEISQITNMNNSKTKHTSKE